jgi:hypothetical protein
MALASSSKATWSPLPAPGGLLLAGSAPSASPWPATRRSGARTPAAVKATERRLARASARKRAHGEVDDKFLRRRRVSRKTEQVYLDSVGEFERRTGCVLEQGMTADDVDSTLEQYITDLYRDGHTASAARFAVYAVAWYLTLPTRSPSCLVFAKAALKGFGRLSRDQSRDPAPWEAWCLVAKWLIDNDSSNGVDYAAALICMYDHYFRPGEQVALRYQHIVAPPRGADPRYHQWAIIVCPSDEPRTTKTHAQDDTVTTGSANPDRKWVVGVVAALRSRARSHDVAVHRFTLNQLESAFRRAVFRLDLSQLKLTPHCGRHGGPSTDMLLGVTTLRDVQRRGRWEAPSSVKRYEKHGKLLRQLNLMTECQRAAGLKAAGWLSLNLAQLVEKSR